MGAPNTENQRHQAAVAWVAVTAPGTLLAVGVILLAVCVTPWLVPRLWIEPLVRVAAATLLVAHLLSTISIQRSPTSARLARTLIALLAAEAALCGLLLGADAQLRAPGFPFALTIIALALGAGGWLAACLSAAAAAFGGVIAAASGIDPALLLRSTRFAGTTMLSLETAFPGGHVSSGWFSTLLSVETIFGGAPAGVEPTRSFSTLLSVETSFAGAPALRVTWGLFEPAVVLATVALCLGLAVSLARLRRSRRAVRASLVAASQLAS